MAALVMLGECCALAWGPPVAGCWVIEAGWVGGCVERVWTPASCSPAPPNHSERLRP